jgi:hypothetical protein
MTTRTRKAQLRQLRSRLLLSVAVLATALAALAPAASGYGFQPETSFVNANPPVQQPFEALLPDFSNFETFTGILVEGINQGTFYYPKDLEWIDKYRKADEMTQAGGHPDFETSLSIDTSGSGGERYTKDIYTDLPPGSVGAPLAVPRCDAAELQLTVAGKCPTQSQVGEALTNPLLTFYSPVYSIIPPEGESAEFAYKAFIITAVLFPRVRSESDYGLTVEVRNITSLSILGEATLALWGVPYDGLHDEHRFETNNGTVGASVTGAAIRPFSTSPTNCDTGPLTTGIKIRSWAKQETWYEENFGASEQEGCVKSNEKQKVVIRDAYSGSTFTLSFEGKTTEALDYDSTAEEVQAALEALESIGESNVKVEGGQVPVPSAKSASANSNSTRWVPLLPSTKYAIEFVGALKDQNVQEITADGSGLIGGEASVNVEVEANGSEEEIEFAPEVHATPTTPQADQPSGLNLTVHVPQNTECEERPFANSVEREEAIENGESTLDCPLSTSNTKKLKVALPGGMVLNPSAANGLGSCSPAGIGLTTPIGSKPIHFSGVPANCPNDSKIGTVEVDTPLLEAPMPGDVYLAEPYVNPFQSLVAIYIGVDDKQRGIVAKFAGQLEADPSTGQLVTTVDEQPQLPLETIRIKLKQGPHAPLRTPPTCGNYTTKSELTPYSAPGTPVSFEDTFSIDSSPTGSCGAEPNTPSFDAGVVSPIAGQYSPLTVNLSRGDGTQEFHSVSITMPKGIGAKLLGIPYCSDAAIAAAGGMEGKQQLANPSCPTASEVGSVAVAAGSGPAPYNLTGHAYLAGPYKGAPLSLAIITPATAGPFDLGTVVVRVALNVDPVTAQITAVSDNIPSILEGIPLDIKSVALHLDRNEFSKNPTSCDPTSVDGSLLSTMGSTVGLSERFQLGECRRLGFKPKLFLRLAGKRVGRRSHPKLTATVVPREGDANIGFAQVKMPNSLLLDQSHISTVCTRVQFAADACPAASIYGYATAKTPLFDQPLSGNVYLRSSQHKLPDLVADLNGQVSVELSGRTDAVKGALRNTFEVVPDAPVSQFVLHLRGGQRGLLQATKNLCKGKQKATVTLKGHNGRVSVGKQLINIPRCHKKHRGRHARHLRAAARQGA